MTLTVNHWERWLALLPLAWPCLASGWGEKSYEDACCKLRDGRIDGDQWEGRGCSLRDTDHENNVMVACCFCFWKIFEIFTFLLRQIWLSTLDDLVYIRWPWWYLFLSTVVALSIYRQTGKKKKRIEQSQCAIPPQSNRKTLTPNYYLGFFKREEVRDSFVLFVIDLQL